MILSINRPAKPGNYWETIGHNFPLLFISGIIVLTAYLFPVEKYPLGFCVFLHLTGIPCPTCGFTRAFCAFANADFAKGIGDCPFALLIFGLTVLIFFYNLAAVILGIFGLRIQRGNWLQLSSKKTVFLAALFFVLLMANWIYRLIMGLR